MLSTKKFPGSNFEPGNFSLHDKSADKACRATTMRASLSAPTPTPPARSRTKPHKPWVASWHRSCEQKEDKNTGEETELPLRCSFALSEHFPVWVRRLTHILTHTSFNVLQQKSTENRSFRCFLELLGGFEPPTSSLPRMRSTD